MSLRDLAASATLVSARLATSRVDNDILELRSEKPPMFKVKCVVSSDGEAFQGGICITYILMASGPQLPVFSSRHIIRLVKWILYRS